MRYTWSPRLAGTGILVVALTWVALAACEVTVATSPAPTEAASVPGSEAPPASSGASAGQANRPTLPDRFPVPSGAKAATLPNDQTVIARWTYDTLGDAAYKFYLDALPRAGYSIVGQYPGGGGAVIRFQRADGQVWQLVTQPDEQRMSITLQTDRP